MAEMMAGEGPNDNGDEYLLTMAEHEGEQEDPFADLLPEARKSERTTQILALATFIASAKDRGNSWTSICRRLEEKKAISVSPDHLRMIMERYADYRAKTRKRSKSNTKLATKQNKKAARKANIGSSGEANTKAGVTSGESEEQTANTITGAEPRADPAFEPTKSNTPDLRHAAYRRAGQKP